ncbi:MAG: DMT family transporter [Chloroflexi bacterium]|nr:DMT family transporter [Chloroflexota bacterium]
MSHRRPLLPYLVLTGGVLIVATASILIRLAQQQGVGSLTIAAGRLGLAALVLTPLAWWRAGTELRSLSKRDYWLGGLSGLFLAVHFATWISSLAYTSVASSAALVTTNPLWVGIASLVILKEKVSRAALIGVALTFAGSLLIVLSDAGATAQTRYTAPLLGNSLALTGAVAITGYFLIGRNLRQRLSLLAYIWLAYTSAALFLLIASQFSGQGIFGLTPLAYLLLLGLALGPQLLGHTSFNWSLRHLSATFVAVAILGEPIGSALLAWLLFGESFASLQLAGFVLLLLGIYVAARSEAGQT